MFKPPIPDTGTGFPSWRDVFFESYWVREREKEAYLFNSQEESKMMPRRGSKLRRLVLDVLKPHSPTLPEFATNLTSISGVKGVNVTLIEIDKDTETLKVTLEGKLDYSDIRSAIEDWGGVIHSVDEVSAGSIGRVEGSARIRLRPQTEE